MKNGPRSRPGDETLPADATTRATLAVKADRWWRDLTLVERLNIVTDYQPGTVVARGMQPPI